MASQTFVLPATVGAEVGNPTDAAGLARAAVIGSRVVQAYRGLASLTDADEAMDPDNATELVPALPQDQQAALLVAVRCYRAPDAVFGVIGADVATAVRSYIPDLDVLLMGLDRSWGVA